MKFEKIKIYIIPVGVASLLAALGLTTWLVKKSPPSVQNNIVESTGKNEFRNIKSDEELTQACSTHKVVIALVNTSEDKPQDQKTIESILAAFPEQGQVALVTVAAKDIPNFAAKHVISPIFPSAFIVYENGANIKEYSTLLFEVDCKDIIAYVGVYLGL